ncbi:MAG: DUF1588 domain-containing protein [Verrucomicrobiales bacterium]
MRLSLVILLCLGSEPMVLADSVDDFHDVRGRQSKATNLALDQVIVNGNTIEHLGTNHEGYYSITFDPVEGATGIEFEWVNDGPYRHWTVREIEAYANFGTRIDIVSGKVIPGPERGSDNAFANAFDGNVDTFTYSTASLTTTFPQRTLLELGSGSHSLDRIRINDVAGNDDNGRMKQITVRVTTDKDNDLASRKYVDVSNLSVHIFGENLIEGELLPMKGQSRPQGMKNFGDQWSGDAHLLWDGFVNDSMETTIVVDKSSEYSLMFQLTKAPDYGQFDIYLGEKVIASNIDLYSTNVVLADPVNVSGLKLDKGQHKIKFKLIGTNTKADPYRKDRYLLGVDYIKITNMLPTAKDFKNNLAEKQVPEKEGSPVVIDSDYSGSDSLNVTLKDVKPILASRCYGCHGDNGKVKGKINLKKVQTRKDFLEDIELTQKIIDALNFKEMPPEDEKQLSEKEHKMMSALFSSYLDTYIKESGSLKPTVMRRMNRYEYNNAVRDLLQLKGDVYPLPEKVIRSSSYFNPSSGKFPNSIRLSNRALGKNQIEQHILTGVSPFAIDLQSEHGFNNRGDELSVSPIMVETFLNLGRSIVNAPEFDGYSNLTDSSFFKVPDAMPLTRKHLEVHLSSFLEKAFRKPVNPDVMGRYTSYLESELRNGKPFDESIKKLITAIISSPRFFYISEQKNSKLKNQPLSAYELATRLSFFLWSSIPDDELLSLARDGTLLDSKVYDSQISRLLESPKSKSISENFARQWLRLDQLITAVPDFDRFQIYYSRIGCEQWKFGLQTMIEPLLLFESIMVEDRSIMLLVDSNYSYRSDEMQSWYNDSVPFGKRQNRNRFSTNSQTFTRRTLPSRREGGVITSAATLTMTSEPLRTSPIRRGAWVATVIFNKPPPPPPDVIPEIEQDDAEIEKKGITLRQRLVAHQENESCVSCHKKIDPLGFALENFDAVGRWRDNYGSGLDIDASGEIFGENKFKDIIGLKDTLLRNPHWFMRSFIEHMLSYSLGRELDINDKHYVDKILAKVILEKGKFSTVVTEITKSYPFMNKTNQSE